MRAMSATAVARSIKIDRSQLRDAEESFGSILTEIARLLYPAPNTAAQIAAMLDCSVRNVELALSGKQNWNGDAVAFFVAEICRRHAMRNVKVIARS